MMTGFNGCHILGMHPPIMSQRMQKQKNLSPVVLFVYNRPKHTALTVEALQKNELASESDLIIFSDAPKTDEHHESVDEVRQYIKTIQGFKSINIIFQEKNKGLADSIIDGVTHVVNQYGRIIVLEDDIVTSPYFLTFMNAALDRYENEPKVWHVSGWNYPIDTTGLPQTFFWRVMNCWGWATWKNRWVHFRKEPELLINTWNKEKIKRFNLDGAHDFWSQVIGNKTGKLNTWAIFWYVSIFNHHGLCLNPIKSYVINIGLDGSGTHCGNNNIFTGEMSNQNANFVDNFIEHSLAVSKIKEFLYTQNYKKRSLKEAIQNIYKRLILWQS
jgi:hypothetical protein